MSDKFDDFLNRLEMPLSEPVIVTLAEKVMDVPVACMRCAGALIEQTFCVAMPANAPERKSFCRTI
jgi:hypothetical protein